MSVVSIFMTNPDVEGFHPFDHDGLLFTFSHIDSRGPKSLVEGEVWIFVDWVMDDISGLEMCRRLRANPHTAPAHITMVLEEDDTESRRRALQAGADDYMTGTFDRSAVLDRVMALQSGSAGSEINSRVVRGSLEIDIAAWRAYWNGKAINIRPNEFRLLRFLAQHPNQVLTRSELIAGLGKAGAPIDERTVDVWVGRLRRAIRAAGGDSPLRTVRSRGYVFDLR